MIVVVLSWFEMFQAGQVGVMRQIEALKNGRRHRAGYEGDGWSIHVNGACAELAVAKSSGQYWESLAARPHELAGDVGRLQVRWRRDDSFDLILQPDDADDAWFVLVTGSPPRLTIVGAILAGDGKRQDWWGDPYGTGRPAFWVPRAALEPVPWARG